jgi:hypothetical protein
MAKTRYIKDGFFMNEDLADCSAYARLLFAGLWLLADREGRLEDRPRRIKGELFPYNDINAGELLSELSSFGFIVRYEVKGSKYIQIPNFSKHQRIHPHEATSQIPSPDNQEQDTAKAEQAASSTDKSLQVPTLNVMSPFDEDEDVYVKHNEDEDEDGRIAPTVNVLLQAFSETCKKSLENLNEIQVRKMGKAIEDLRALTKQPDEVLAPRVRRFGEWFTTRGFTDPTPAFSQVVSDWEKFEAAEKAQKPSKAKAPISTVPEAERERAKQRRLERDAKIPQQKAG